MPDASKDGMGLEAPSSWNSEDEEFIIVIVLADYLIDHYCMRRLGWVEKCLSWLYVIGL